MSTLTTSIAKLEAEIAQAIESGTDQVVRKKLADARKLLKQVKELEDKLEEAKDEADDWKKRNNKLKTEISDFQKKFDDEVRKGKNLLDEKNEVKARLDSVRKDFELRGESLDFVKEILTAERTSDKSVHNLYNLVDSIVDFIQNEVKECYSATGQDLNDFFGSNVDAWAANRKKIWIQGKTSIAFVGEFSAGKTSIVNRILSQDNPNVPLLPVNSKATTAIPTYISGGVSTFFQFVTPDNELKSISERTFKRVSKEVLDQVRGVSSLIQYFVMTYKNPHLERLSILDTPGFSSNDKEDAERTIGVINECDALFWVVDVNAGNVNRESIKIIRNNLTKPLYVVINQIDTKSTKDVDSVEKLIRKTLQNEGVKIDGIIRFSKKEPLNNILSPILAIKHNTEREQYLTNLVNDMTSKVNNLSAVVKSVHQECNRLENQHQQLSDEFKGALFGLIEDCRSLDEIPQQRWYSNSYGLSQEQHSEFKNLLHSIRYQHVPRIDARFEEQRDTVSKLQSAWDRYSQAKDNYRRLGECLKTLNSKAKQLDQVPQTKSVSLYTAPKQQTNTVSNIQQNSAQCEYKPYINSHFIIAEKGDKVKIAYSYWLKDLNDRRDKKITGNALRKYFPECGINGWISRSNLDLALTDIHNNNV